MKAMKLSVKEGLRIERDSVGQKIESIPNSDGDRSRCNFKDYIEKRTMTTGSATSVSGSTSGFAGDRSAKD